jgi:hypothetical protein
MGLPSIFHSVNLANPVGLYRPPQTYLVATGAYNLFTIAGGAIEIINLTFRNTGAPVGGTTVRVTVGGINTDAGAVDIGTAGVVGGIWWAGLNVAATGTSALGAPRTVATATTMLAGTGTIICTFGVGTSLTGEWGIIYRRLSPQAIVALA